MSSGRGVMKVTPTRVVAFLALAVVCGFGLGAGLKALGSESPPALPTVGPMIPGQSDPDLVAIDLPDGRSGFLRSDEMGRSNLDPAFRRVVNDHMTETVLPVYKRDGKTVIGEFVAGTTSWE